MRRVKWVLYIIGMMIVVSLISKVTSEEIRLTLQKKHNVANIQINKKLNNNENITPIKNKKITDQKKIITVVSKNRTNGITEKIDVDQLTQKPKTSLALNNNKKINRPFKDPKFPNREVIDFEDSELPDGKIKRISLIEVPDSKNKKYKKYKIEEKIDSNTNEVLSSREMIASQFVLKVNDDVTEENLKDSLKETKLSIQRKLPFSKIYVINCPSNTIKDLDESIKIASIDHTITKYAEPDYIVYKRGNIPNDALYDNLWGMDKIVASKAWEITTGSKDIIVAVIDEGVDVTHPDLKDNIWHNEGEDWNGDQPGNNGIDDDENGYIDDNYGIIPGNVDKHNAKPVGAHGTHCSGTIGATGNNNIGVVGVNWAVKIMTINIFHEKQEGTTSDVIEAINYSKNMGAHLSSNSWGGDGEGPQSMKDAIEDFGGLFVGACGNYGWDNDLKGDFPSGFDLDNIIAVAATNSRDVKADWSSYGKTTVDLAAPGVGIMSTVFDGKYEKYDGTSMACPHVAGAAALLLSVKPDATAIELKKALMEGTDIIPSLINKTVSGGRLNLYKALLEINSAENLKLTSPSNKTVFKRGSINTITWAENNVAGSLKIELVKGNKLIKVISDNTDNDGSFNWIPNNDLEYSNQYQIILSSLNDYSSNHISDTFTLGNNPPTVKFVNLIHGEVLYRNELLPLEISILTDDTNGVIVSSSIEVNGKIFNGNSATWTPPYFGSYTVIGKALDNDGEMTTEKIIIDYPKNPGYIVEVATNDPGNLWWNTLFVIITNSSKELMDGWRIEFDFNYAVNNFTNAEVVSHVGEHYIIKNNPWGIGKTIDPGDFAAAYGGFALTGQAIQPGELPRNITFNGDVVDFNLPPSISFNTPAYADSYVMNKLSPININVTAEDEEGEVKEVTIFVDDRIFNGSDISWTPSHYGDFDISTVAVDDKNKASTSTISISVMPEGSLDQDNNIPPSITIDSHDNGEIITQKTLSPIFISIDAKDSDGTISSQSITAEEKSFNGSSASWTPSKFGSFVINATAIDNDGASANATISVVVNQKLLPKPPIANNDTIFTLIDESITIDVLSNDSDPNNETINISSFTDPSNGTVIIENGIIKYYPNSGFIGEDQFSYMIINDSGLTATGVVTVTIKGKSSFSKVNATYWSAWGGNESYPTNGKIIKSVGIEMDKVDTAYNVIITAFIITKDGNYELALGDPGDNTGSAFTKEKVKEYIVKTKAQGRKVLVSLGGAEFDMVLSNNDDANKFKTQVSDIIDEYGFEGLDIDFEASLINRGQININLFADSITEIVNDYRSKGIDFWLTAAPEWPYIIPYTYGPDHQMAGSFYLNLISRINLDNFNYIWPQTYNQGSANGVTDFNGSKVVPGDGMDKFLAAIAWGITTTEGYNANGGNGLFIPKEKLALGIPATDGASGGNGLYTVTSEDLRNAWNLMTQENVKIAGLMNWSVDWDAMEIKDGDLSYGYTHYPWEIGKTAAQLLGIDPNYNFPPEVNILTPEDNHIFEQINLSPITIQISTSDSDGTISSSKIEVDEQIFNGTSANWTPSSFGTFKITAIATDDENTTSSNTITVTVKNPNVVTYIITASVISTGADSYPEFVQPASAPDIYMIGDKVTFNGNAYESVINNNSWSPTDYPAGWKSIPNDVGTANGSINPEGSIEVNKTESQLFTMLPNSGFKVKYIEVDGVSIGNPNSYTFSNVIANHTISVEFEKGVTPVNNPPTVQIINPANGAVFECENLSPISISIDAKDSDGVIASQSITVEGQIYSGSSTSWTPSKFGAFTIVANATDDKGASVSDTVQITVNKKDVSNKPPVVSFIIPVNGQVFKQEMLSPIDIKFTSSDSDGIVEQRLLSVDSKFYNSEEVTFTPSKFGTFTIIAHVIDNDGANAEVSIQITVEETNIPAPPVAKNDLVTTDMNKSIAIYVLENDTGSGIELESVTSPSNGTSFAYVNQVNYTPAEGYSGNDSFTYTIKDSRGRKSTGTVNITVNAPFDPTEKSFIFGDVTVFFKVYPEQTPWYGICYMTGTITGAQKDWDMTVNYPNGQVIGYAIGVAQPSGTGGNKLDNYGTLGSGEFTLFVMGSPANTLPDNVSFNGSGPINNPPIAQDDMASVEAGKSIIVNILSNDTDSDRDEITIAEVTSPSMGTVSISGDTVIYTANSGIEGTDIFSYTISDGNGGIDTATVTVGVTKQESNKLPTIEILTPENNQEIEQTELSPITIIIKADDEDGTIDSTLIEVDGQKFENQNSVFWTPNNFGTYQIMVRAVDNDGFSSTQVITVIINKAEVVDNSGQIYYHLEFPSDQGQGESISLDENFTDLIMSNFIAGVLWGHMINSNETFKDIKLNKDYIYGSILSQLLQENLGTDAYVSSMNWIHPDPTIRNMLLNIGQGGPYQINDYAKRLSSGYGMINFVALQKNLGYTVEDQDSLEQNKNTGPELLYDKFFGPIAAAYFQYNGSVLRLHAINQDTWGPQYQYYNDMLINMGSIEDNFFDMVWNAAYNAGPWSDIQKIYTELGANFNNSAYTEKISNINNYNLDNISYSNSIGSQKILTGTFVLYPRQVRHYLDQLYNNSNNLGYKTENNLVFRMSVLKDVFAKVFNTLGYINSSDIYTMIDENDSNGSFESALSSNNVHSGTLLNISNKADRIKIFSVLEATIKNLENSLNFKFNEVTENNLGQ